MAHLQQMKSFRKIGIELRRGAEFSRFWPGLSSQRYFTEFHYIRRLSDKMVDQNIEKLELGRDFKSLACLCLSFI